MGTLTAARAAWRLHADDLLVFSRAWKRRQHNLVRQANASRRRAKVASLLAELGDGPGVQAEIAKHLGVSKATICRDVRAIKQAGVHSDRT